MKASGERCEGVNYAVDSVTEPKFRVVRLA